MGAILTVNGGSSSLKCGLFRLGGDTPELLYGFRFSNLSGAARYKVTDAAGTTLEEGDAGLEPFGAELRHQASLDRIFRWLEKHAPEHQPSVVSHRVVHGGELHREPVRITGEVLDALRQFIPLAPLHQPYNLRLIEACRNLLPALPQIACFDTMFHTGQPAEARRFAIPRHLTDAGVKRYGFHGLSYEFIQRTLNRDAPDQATQPSIIAHLGAGASMCAVKEGRSQASTMGFTAVEGLPMGTRCGSIDPGVLLYLQRQHGMDADALERLIYKESGWLGVSGISGDMQELLASDHPHAREAIDLFCYRAAREIGSLAAALEGLQQLVFTGGVGENSPEIRELICQRCQWLGVELDAQANREQARIISTPGSRVTVRVIPTNEEAMLALHGAELLTDGD